MINLFLKAKHWQLFMLTFGLPFIVQVTMTVSMFSNVISETQNNQAHGKGAISMLQYMQIFPFIMLLFMGVLFGWFWSVAIGLQKKVPSDVKMKTGKFKIFLIIPMVYMLFFLVLISTAFNGLLNNVPPSENSIFRYFAVIIPMHFFSMFCIFYSLYFVAKTYKTVELQREVKFGDFVGEFFMIWFFPVGVWFIQPKINKMMEQVETEK